MPLWRLVVTYKEGRIAMRITKKQVLYVLADIFCCVVSLFLAALFRFDMSISVTLDFFRGREISYLLIAVVSLIVAGIAGGTYKCLYINIRVFDAVRQLLISMFSGFSFFICHFIFDIPISTAITFFYAFFLFAFTVLVRLSENIIFRRIHQRVSGKNVKRVLVVGAGMGGAMLMHMLTLHRDMQMLPVAVVDDDDAKQNMSVSGVRVVGKIADTASAAAKYRVDEIVIAIPSASSELVREICDKCKNANLPIKMFGNVIEFNEFISGAREKLRDVSIEDLLFRDSVKTDMSFVKEYIQGKTILVTGGAGSIGSEICRHVLECGCEKLVIMDINENGLFFLKNELSKRFSPERFCMRLGSIRDKTRMSYLFRRYKFDMVLHAAAHKHVPLMEENVFEVVKNNVFGTKNTIECCIENGVKKFVLISTDKAVNPTNVMGATKRIAELLVQRYNGEGGCEMAAVRFGNVLGSNGSVIPIFKKQIEAGGPVTVTHRDIKRYFMTIPEAVSLVLKCGTFARGGEVFVLDMGKPVSIYELAENTIALAGLRPGRDIEIKITGLRPGEKLYEELYLDTESLLKTEHEKIFVVHAESLPEKTDEDIEELSRLLETDSGEVALRDKIFACAMNKEEVHES